MQNEGDNNPDAIVPLPTERTPLLIAAPNKSSINNPLQEKLQIKKLKLIYSAITLADIFQKVVHTTFTTSFLLFSYTFLDLTSEKSLAAFYILGASSALLACLINLNIDYFLSRQKAIVVGFIIYTVGFAVLSGFAAEPPAGPNTLEYVTIIPLLLICIGDGICKSCISDFTHSQFEDQLPSLKLNYFLTKLFWIGHIGAFLLILFLLGIIEYTKFELAYGLGCICILAGLISYMMGWNSYTAFGRNKSSLIKLIWTILFDARKKRNCSQGNSKRPSPIHESIGGKNCIGHWMDYAKHSYGGPHTDMLVEQTKSFFKIFVLFLSFIPYWVANSQCYSMFIYQAMHLERMTGNFRLPVTWVALCHVAAVLLFVQVLDKGIQPCLRKKGYHFLPSWKISIGLIFGMVSMLCATFVAYVTHGKQSQQAQKTFHLVGHKNMTYISDVHVLWTIPQFTLLGISEILVGLTGLGIACRLCKGLLQKGITSLYYVTIGIGHGISLLIIEGNWFPSNHYLDTTNMITFFACMAASCFTSLILFLLVVMFFDFDGRKPKHAISVSYTHHPLKISRL